MKQYTDQQLKERIRLFDAIFVEHKNQIKKWGIQSHTMDRWNTILSEEVGSLAKAINQSDSQRVYNEAIQVATLSLKIAEMILNKK